MSDLCTTTSVAGSQDWKEDRIWLNGKEEDISLPRIQNCIGQIRALAKSRQSVSEAQLSLRLRIVTRNNFPTAAGLASSASGYAALTYALASFYKLTGVVELSTIARMGSGSACRSIYGGFVKWEMGKLPSGEDSRAIQVAPETHWDSLQILICVVSHKKKSMSSTKGMQLSVQTSELLQHRIQKIVPERMKLMESAIQQRDFAAFGEITMKDSNQFHAICADTFPPFWYMNATSHSIVQYVTAYNEKMGGIKAAYTFDAGPNAVIYTEKKTLPHFLKGLLYYYPPGQSQAIESYFPKTQLLQEVGASGDDFGVAKDLLGIQDRQRGFLQQILHTTPGPGAGDVSHSRSLISSSGEPISTVAKI
eukprot:TRINITY_DN16706_c0_g1_i1.p1 TRINITY_DN16706_c0_g1~~TRINITY_DN16706_c0_g1_i1.p1  ORF type:complete len:427 (+),score=52.48 TRINITY_DN16706_c0_g1_i1:192-1283(+)